MEGEKEQLRGDCAASRPAEPTDAGPKSAAAQPQKSVCLDLGTRDPVTQSLVRPTI